jgi:threonine efflux protein
MIDILPILKILPVAAIAMMAPGPDFFLITSIALSRGRMAGILAAAGIATGVVIWSGLGVFGLSVILDQMLWMVSCVRIVGGIYLVYLGTQLWRASFSARPDETPQTTLPNRKRNPFVIGFVTNITNPKAMAFFTSIFALALTPDTNRATQTAIVGIVSIMPFIWFSFMTLALSMPVMRKAYMRWSKWIDRVAGTFLAFFGLRLLWSGNR